ncbi:F-box protein At5g03100-like [Lolium rigidum]|uniref:F-box protein At5g03100-like n=1 Tax=Lolium rigidum TaxID=89674 RepID=UPI001F5C9A5D|nr:F-box protein At5g03100-like [Lolium rigidum]
MMKTSAPMVCGQGPKTDRCVKKTMSRSKGIQLHHLPNDVLRGILSRLTMKEAVRMSILSKKWSTLWKCYPKLVFTRATMRGSNAATTGPAKPLRTRFIRGINSIQRQLKSSNLNKFVVKFALRKRHTPHIDRWINFCAASRAKHVVLDLCPGPKGSSDKDDKYSFPLHLLGASGGSCVKSLSLGFVYLTLPPDHCGFANLKKLSLQMVHVTGDLRCLLPNCAVLEWLSLTKCRMDELSIGQELSRLHYLQVKYCMLQKLDIRAPNLTMFLFAGRTIPILLGEPVKISEATVELITSSDCFSYVFTDLVDALSHVQSLSISFRIETKVINFVKNQTRLTNLRRLVLKIDIVGSPEVTGGILRLAYLLELAPALEELVLHMCCFDSAIDGEPNEDAYRPHPHHHLKTIKMTGFYGLLGQVELALYLLRNATSLERMIIDPVVRNNWFIPSMGGAKPNIDRGTSIALNKLSRQEFRKVLDILY